jgi:hypothetical protein
LAGKDGANSPFSLGSRLRKDGSVLISVYTDARHKNRLVGNLAFAHPLDATNDCDGNISWYQAPRETGYYRAGFYTNLGIVGSRFEKAPAGGHTLSYTGANAEAGVTVTNFDGSMLGSQSLSVDDKDKGSTTAVGPFPVQVSFNRRNGLFKGDLGLAKSSGGSRSISGVVLQRQNRAGGVVKLQTRTGAITITPQ